MTGYVFLLAYERGCWERASAEQQEATYEAHRAFHAFVDQHGKQIASAALADDDVATTVRFKGSEAVVTDGPYAETVEMIGGYYEVELPNLDVAIEAAKLLPREYSIEIRPTIDVGE